MKMVTKEVDPQKTQSFGQEVILEQAGVDILLNHKQQVAYPYITLNLFSSDLVRVTMFRKTNAGLGHLSLFP